MSSKAFYVSTPIYYVNDQPHIGHAYTTVLADVLSRYHRLLGAPTYFLTGTDEHGQKVWKAANARGISPQEQCDTTVVRFQELWRRLEIGNDDFIRTTEKRHTTIVQKVLQDLYDRDLIYRDQYEGYYCVPCERFFTAKDLVDGKGCPECRREVDSITESNYFFRMGRYQQWLIDHIKANPDFIQPAFRANETLGFLRQPLNDLCVSRPKSRMPWGIELPFDQDYVCYVWFDALLNYVTAIGYGVDDVEFQKWWPAAHHLIGKDILTTHTVYWPTMLKAMGLEPPRTILAHGWWLTGRDKMSKSLGNVVNPMEMADKYGVDAFRYFLMAEMTLGQDASFTEDAFVRRYNSDLANDLGNLLSRVVKMTMKNFDGRLPAIGGPTELEDELRGACLAAAAGMAAAVNALSLDKGLAQVMEAVRAGNRYIDAAAPWRLAKEGDTTRLATVLANAAEALRITAGLLQPAMPAAMDKLRRHLGLTAAAATIDELGEWRPSANATPMEDVDSLFPRIKVESAESAAPPATGKSKGGTPAVKSASANTKTGKPNMNDDQNDGLVSIDEFFKTQLRTAKVLDAEKVEGADKLLRLEIEIGAEKRQIVAGVAKFYTPEQMLGKTVIVVANLKPAKIRGIESNGMLLAAKNPDGELTLVTVAADVPSGLAVG